MKNKALILFICLAAAVSLAACSDDDESAAVISKASSAQQSEAVESNDASSEETSSEEAAEDSSQAAESESSAEEESSAIDNSSENESSQAEEPEQPQVQSEIPFGIWWVKGDDTDAYYSLRPDGTGAVVYQDTGTGSGFEYELDGNVLTISFDPEIKRAGTIDFSSGNFFTVTFEGGEPEDWVYVDDIELDSFSFYSNQELIEMARKFLKATYNEETEYAYAEIDENGMIVIQLFDNSDGHNSTAAWYIVDRFTAKGTDGSGVEVDLTAIPVG